MTTSHSVIVVGAGISGLACAHALKKSGHDILVIDSEAHPGGIIRSASDSGFLFEAGPQSFNNTSRLAALIHDLGIAGELIVAPPRAPRYVLLNGKLKAVPLSPPALLTTSLLSWSTKFSLLAEPFRTTRPPNQEESVASFVRRKFTGELLDRLVAPFVSGIYAGDPKVLSLAGAFPQVYEAEKSAGSIIRGMKRAAKQNPSQDRPALASFRNGNHTLTNALAKFLGPSLLLNTRVSSIGRSTNGEFSVIAETTSGAQNFTCRNLVLATPTKTAAEIGHGLAPAVSKLLAEIEYAPISVISLGYRRANVSNSLHGFGFLVPKTAQYRLLGAVWNSSLFPGRTPADHVLLTTFQGGALDTIGALHRYENPELVHDELAQILGIFASPVITRKTFYENAIPQYNLGHLDRLAAIQSELAKIPGLHLTGNYLKGPAIGTCVEHAQSVAESVRIG